MREVDEREDPVRSKRLSRPGVGRAIDRERPQAGLDRRVDEAERVAGRGRRQRVRDVVARQAGDRDRQVRRLDPAARRSSPRSTIQPSSSVAARPPRVERREPRGPTLHAEGVDLRPGLATHRPRAGVVGIEDRPAVALRDPHDRRLHVGELVDGVDPLEAPGGRR